MNHDIGTSSRRPWAGVGDDRIEEELHQWTSVCDVDEPINDVRGDLVSEEASYNGCCVRGGKFYRLMLVSCEDTDHEQIKLPSQGHAFPAAAIHVAMASATACSMENQLGAKI